MKLLISAYSCCPTKTSEPGNAWRTINEALKEHEVWAVIEEEYHYREWTEKYLAEHPMPGFHPIFRKLSPVLGGTLRGRGPLESIYYHRWQESLAGFVQKLHQQIGFDLVHHVTYGRYWSPCGVRVLGLPFIWGPVGAAETPPKPFVSELPFNYRLFEWLRDTARARAHRSRALRDTARAATIAIGVTSESCSALKSLGAQRVERLPQTALTEEDLATFGKLPSPPPGPFRAICIGRHMHWKGFHLAIRAFAAFAKTSPDAELWIINDGPFRGYLKKTAHQTGIATRVKFLGIMPTYQDVLQKLGESHVLLHPALHEGFGNVCLEAMAAGRPVGCLDIGGPASQITPETGFAAPITNPQEAVAALSTFLQRLDSNRSLLSKMSLNAREHVNQHFTMQRMNQTMRRFYSEATSRV